MKFKFLLAFLFVFSCGEKQDFKEDIRIPKLLKNYAEEQQDLKDKSKKKSI